jgi:hypothetical protein
MKALWLNPVATGSTSLDISINPHDVDWIAHSRLLEKLGFTVYLHEPFLLKSRHSSYSPKIYTKDLDSFSADLVILSVSPFIGDYAGWKYHEEIKRGTSRSKNLDIACDFLDRHQGELQLFIDDPRPAFQQVFLKPPKAHHRIFDHIKKAKLIVADKNFLDPSLRERAVESDYWKLVDVGPIKPFDRQENFFCVYPGLKTQRKARVEQIRSWFNGRSDCFSLGEIRIPGIDSLSNFEKVSLDRVLGYVSKSTTTVVTGEPEHTWLTPRAIQSLCQGTICSIHPEFPGRHWFPDNILKDQTFAKADDFDRSLLTEEIYNRQVDFARSLEKLFTK